MPLQEPGRYLARTVVPSVVLLPQRHEVITFATSAATTTAVPISGCRVTILLSMLVSLKPVAVTRILPMEDVTTVCAYLLPEAVLVCSQPQLFSRAACKVTVE